MYLSYKVKKISLFKIIYKGLILSKIIKLLYQIKVF